MSGFDVELEELFKEVSPFILPTFKLCRGCGVQKPLAEFNNRNDRRTADKNGKVSRCKACTMAAAKAWYYKDHEKSKLSARAKQYLRRHEGRITENEALELAADNTGLCEICNKQGIIYIDHNHATEKRRGFLCYSCNTLLGNAQDSLATLTAAIIYLKKYGAV